MEKQQQGKEMELWLPEELDYEDFFAEGKKWKDDGLGTAFPSEIPFLFASNPDSPVESVTETETESDEEDYLAGLTQRMAHSFLHDDEVDENCSDASFEAKDCSADKAKPAAATIAVSPQSTLCSGLLASKILPSKEDTISEPVSAAAKQSEKASFISQQDLQQLKQVIEFEVMHQQQQIKKPTPVAPVPYKNTTGYFTSAMSHAHLRTAQFHPVKPQQLPLPAGQNKASGAKVGNYHALGLPSSAWPPLQKPQQQNMVGSGMRAVFLNSPGVRKESAGTGVFLPRIAGSKAEPPRRKQACSPVLVPARVVQALSLNLEQLGAQPRYTNAGAYAQYLLNHELVLRRNSSFAAYQKQRANVLPQPAVVGTGDVHLLPQEWTY